MAIEIKNKVILVTGGAGFIGSHLVEKLIAGDAIVIVADNRVDPNSLFAINNLNKKAIFEKCDISEFTQCKKLFKKYNFDYIYHIAAQAIVTDSHQNPYETFKTNIFGTIHMLEMSRKSKKIKAIIIASSDKAYGNTTTKYTEGTPLMGRNIYDVSK